MPPTVQNLSDLVNQYTTATQPEFNQIDSNIASNDQSGTAQTQGLDAAKTSAFGGITQNANNRGMYFSGFTPDAEAKYTASTYLPALAKLQSTIAATRDSLLGQKATLNTGINTNALNTQKSEQSALDTYNQNQATQAAELQRQQEAEAAAAQQGALNRAATASSSAAKASSQAAPAAQQRADKGFNFQDANGKAISAKTYATLTGQNFNALLQQMANAGDAGAQGYIKSGGKQYASALAWG